MKNICISLSFFISFSISAQHYNVLLIPDSLVKKADAVTRYEEMRIEIKSPGKASVHEKYVHTILNDDGLKYADYSARYDRFKSINSIDGILYDGMGKELKKVKNKDILDHSAYDGISLMQDARYKEHNFFYKEYPFTTEYEEESDLDGIFYLSDWYFQQGPYIGVQQSKLVVVTPKDYKLHYK
ncbi:MAG TPA: DUF3857 domain-containing protein, partial [Chitinophagaceae bacterium]|nr:DUF3857 domain-containing protein [Chitinophagaceae bacterium]